MAGVPVRVVEHVPPADDKRAWTRVKLPSMAFAEQVMDELAKYEAISSIEVQQSSRSLMIAHHYSLEELLERLKWVGCEASTLDTAPRRV